MLRTSTGCNSMNAGIPANEGCWGRQYPQEPDGWSRARLSRILFPILFSRNAPIETGKREDRRYRLMP